MGRDITEIEVWSSGKKEDVKENIPLDFGKSKKKERIRNEGLLGEVGVLELIQSIDRFAIANQCVDWAQWKSSIVTFVG